MGRKVKDGTHLNRDWLDYQYTILKRFDKEIAKECNVSIGTINQQRKKFNIVRIERQSSSEKKKKIGIANSGKNSFWYGRFGSKHGAWKGKNVSDRTIKFRVKNNNFKNYVNSIILENEILRKSSKS